MKGGLVGIVIGLVLAVVLFMNVVMPITVSNALIANLTVVVNETVYGVNGTYTTFAKYPIDTTVGILITNTTGTPHLKWQNTSLYSSNGADAIVAYNYTWQNIATTDNANGTVFWVSVPAAWNSSCGGSFTGAGIAGANPICATLKATYGYQTASYSLIGSSGRIIYKLLPLFIALAVMVVIAYALMIRKR